MSQHDANAEIEGVGGSNTQSIALAKWRRLTEEVYDERIEADRPENGSR